ncbi:MAG TPA: hypothetical protein PKA50_18945, partial [Gemmatimonadales bacterium]|nr:hypothetical protein [Gemmatimonadales bacterium]
MAVYWSDTRAPRYSFVFAFPLLLLYEALAHLISGASGVRNGADVLLKSLFSLLGGAHGLTAFAVVVLGSGLALIIHDWRKSGAPQGRYFAGMAVESVLYALLFGGVTSTLTVAVAWPPLPSLIVYVNESMPLKFRFGRYVRVAPPPETTPFIAVPRATMLSVSPGFTWTVALRRACHVGSARRGPLAGGRDWGCASASAARAPAAAPTTVRVVGVSMGSRIPC